MDYKEYRDKFYCSGKDEIIFQQDNDPKHTVKLVGKYIERVKYVLSSYEGWTSHFPDLNSI